MHYFCIRQTYWFPFLWFNKVSIVWQREWCYVESLRCSNRLHQFNWVFHSSEADHNNVIDNFVKLTSAQDAKRHPNYWFWKNNQLHWSVGVVLASFSLLRPQAWTILPDRSSDDSWFKEIHHICLVVILNFVGAPAERKNINFERERFVARPLVCVFCKMRQDT